MEDRHHFRQSSRARIVGFPEFDEVGKLTVADQAQLLTPAFELDGCATYLFGNAAADHVGGAGLYKPGETFPDDLEGQPLAPQLVRDAGHHLNHESPSSSSSAPEYTGREEDGMLSGVEAHACDPVAGCASSSEAAAVRGRHSFHELKPLRMATSASSLVNGTHAAMHATAAAASFSSSRSSPGHRGGGRGGSGGLGGGWRERSVCSSSSPVTPLNEPSDSRSCTSSSGAGTTVTAHCPAGAVVPPLQPPAALLGLAASPTPVPEVSPNRLSPRSPRPAPSSQLSGLSLQMRSSTSITGCCATSGGSSGGGGSSSRRLHRSLAPSSSCATTSVSSSVSTMTSAGSGVGAIARARRAAGRGSRPALTGAASPPLSALAERDATPYATPYGAGPCASSNNVWLQTHGDGGCSRGTVLEEADTAWNDTENYGAEDYGAGDYGAEDYGAEDYGAGDYGAEDYGAEDYGAGDCGAEDCCAGDYGAEDYGAGDYGAGDYGAGDYGAGDYGASCASSSPPPSTHSQRGQRPRSGGLVTWDKLEAAFRDCWLGVPPAAGRQPWRQPVIRTGSWLMEDSGTEATWMHLR